MVRVLFLDATTENGGDDPKDQRMFVKTKECVKQLTHGKHLTTGNFLYNEEVYTHLFIYNLSCSTTDQILSSFPSLLPSVLSHLLAKQSHPDTGETETRSDFQPVGSFHMQGHAKTKN